MGWSGWGHMTNKLITFTDRFKAASSGAGAADRVSMLAAKRRTFLPDTMIRRNAAKGCAHQRVLVQLAA